MKIYTISALAGQGKTYFICDTIDKGLKVQQKYLLVQPNKKLIDETEKQLLARGLGGRVTKIYDDDGRGNVAKRIVAFMKGWGLKAQVLIITQQAFEHVPYFHFASQVNLIFDEAPTGIIGFDVKLPDSHVLLTKHLKVSGTGPYRKLEVTNKAAVEEIRANKRGDPTYKLLSPLAKRLLHPGWDTFVSAKQYESLIDKSKSADGVEAFAIRNDSVLWRFKSCTVAGAFVEETFFAHAATYFKANLVPHPKLPARFKSQKHDNGNLLTIKYMNIKQMSMRIIDQHPGLITSFAGEIQKDVASSGLSLVWLGNSNVLDDIFSDKNITRLSGSPHGSNAYKDRDAAAIIAGFNPSNSFARFLRQLGLTNSQIDDAFHNQEIYQAIMRISLRDEASTTRKVVYMPDRRSRDYILHRFPGANVSMIQLSIPQDVGKPGRPRKYATTAERKKAYRDRKRVAENLDTVAVAVDSVTDKQSQARDKTTIAYRNIVPLASDHGSFVFNVFDTIHSKRPRQAHNCTSSHQILELLKSYSDNEYARKDWAPLFNLAKGNNSRKKEDVEYVFGIILDNDFNGISPEEFSRIFPELSMWIFNSYSSTAAHSRWRGIIPTTRNTSPTENRACRDIIFAKLAEAGYTVSKPEMVAGTGRAHGFDDKKAANDIFYVPSKPRDPSGAIRLILEGEGRTPLDPDAWLANIAFEPSIYNSDVEDDISLDDSSADDSFEDALRRWYEVGTQPKNGDRELFRLAKSLRELGMSTPEIKPILTRAAQLANSPQDRLNAVPRILEWLDGHHG